MTSAFYLGLKCQNRPKEDTLQKGIAKISQESDVDGTLGMPLCRQNARNRAFAGRRLSKFDQVVNVVEDKV